ncbi:hypothetical protein V8E55_004609 [Tylopilus felleus]
MGLTAELKQHKYQVIYTLPEMVITNTYFNGLLCLPIYYQHLLGIMVDEAHCIVQWGKDFRPAYSKLSKFPTRSFHLNLGNNHLNIYQDITIIPKSTYYSVFDFLYEGVSTAEQILHALIFVNQVVGLQHGWQHWHWQLPPHLRHVVEFLNARWSEHAKTCKLERFVSSEWRVLIGVSAHAPSSLPSSHRT